MLAEPIKDRFHKKYVKKLDGCWIWSAYKIPSGYGQLWCDGKNRRAHRVSYELHKGDIPEGVCVLHRCDTPSCVNPEHLFLGTHKDNVDDKVSKGRQARGSTNGNSKLTEDDIVIIKRRLAIGESHRSIAIDFNVSSTTITDINTGKIWRILR